MAKGHPQLEDLRQLRHARDKMRQIKLAVGADGRNRTVLWPFKSKTSRTQPKASQWIFSPAVWLRSLIKPGPGHGGRLRRLLLDGVPDCGACLTGIADPTIRCSRCINRGDPYLSFAKRVGAAPSWATKTDPRDAARPLQDRPAGDPVRHAGRNPGRRLGVSTFDAHEMLNQHRELFAQYWQWSDDWLAHALDTGVM